MPRPSAAVLDRIRRLDLRTALESYGLRFNRNGKALCPFHDEDTPSFGVKGGWAHCFGCGWNGDLIDFTRERFGLSFPDAVERICADLRVSGGKMTLRERLEKSRAEKLREERDAALRAAETAYLDALSLWLDMTDLRRIAAQIDPLGDATANAYWAEAKARMKLDAAENERQEMISCYRHKPSAP